MGDAKQQNPMSAVLSTLSRGWLGGEVFEGFEFPTVSGAGNADRVHPDAEPRHLARAANKAKPVSASSFPNGHGDYYDSMGCSQHTGC